MRFPLFLGHGELLIPVIFIGLPAAFLGLICLVLAVVGYYRRKASKLSRWTKYLGFAGLALWVIAFCSPAMLPLVDWVFEHTATTSKLEASGETKPSAPEIIAPEKIPSLIHRLPAYAGFGYSGATYFQGKLYVSSNIGLLTIDSGKIESLLQWTKFDAVIEGPWLDKANHVLWAQAANDESLLRFDGSQWTRMSLPEPPTGYSRGDVMNGFSGRSTPQSFWISGGNCIWHWEPGSKSWSLETPPSLPEGSAVKAFFGWNETKVFLTRDGYQRGITTGGNPATVHVFDGTWKKYSGIDADVKESVQTDLFGFVRTQDGLVFQIDRDRMIKLDGPGHCEAIALTSRGNVLASFGSLGVFERLGNKWEKRAESPYSPEEGEHWAHLAEAEGEIALATSEVPQLVPGSSDKFVHSGTAGIWITRNGKFERVDQTK
ncbi:MAG: hypothetical protein ABI273_17255 [Lacunisphaera sp.]